VKAIVCDTGPLLAVLNERDKYHVDCVAFFDSFDGQLIVPSLIVTEVCYLAQTQVGPQAEAKFSTRSSPGNSRLSTLPSAIGCVSHNLCTNMLGSL
jgi:uncharacterized protein